jgi:hypothetical protein
MLNGELQGEYYSGKAYVAFVQGSWNILANWIPIELQMECIPYNVSFQSSELHCNSLKYAFR